MLKTKIPQKSKKKLTKRPIFVIGKYINLARFYITFPLHQKASKIKWYRGWHNLKFAHHVHVFVLIMYLVGVVGTGLGLFNNPGSAYAASNTWSQTTFNGTSDGTYTNSKAANTNADISLKGGIDGTGGTVTHSGGYTIHTFTNVGSSTFTPPTGVSSVEILVVAGGGGGGGGNAGNAGGGGGGGVIYNASYSVGGATSVTVGNGGNAGTNGTTTSDGSNGSNGGNSVFGGLTAIGGGGGARYNGLVINNGATGGSGGGGSQYTGMYTTAGGSGTAGQGYAGGSHGGTSSSDGWGGGGGGGAGAVGGTGQGTSSNHWPQGGIGGDGYASAISGSSLYYGAGGGGSTHSSTTYIAPGGSSGVGGSGQNKGTAGTAGMNGRGGGGGAGGETYSGGAGGSGTVIVRYPTYAASGTYVSAPVAPSGLYNNWGNLTFTICDATHTVGCTGTFTGTTVTIQILKSDGSLVPDSDLPNNSAGFSSSPVSLATLSAANYPSLKIRANLSTSNTSYTPFLSDWSIGYTNDAVQIPTNLTISASTTAANISWSISSSATLGYLVERAPDSAGNPGTWVTAGGTCNTTANTYAASLKTTSCSDTGLAVNTKYYWRVKSIDLSNNISVGAASANVSGWSFPGWSSRVSLTITNFQANFQTKLTIDYSSYVGMQTDFRDIRFVDATAATELPFWIESISGTTATVWVKTGNNNNIYLYYGNASATFASDCSTNANAKANCGQNVFEFFDDFSGNLNKWTVVSGNWVITSGYLHATISSSPALDYLISNYSGTDYVIDVNIRQPAQTFTNWQAGAAFRYTNASSTYYSRIVDAPCCSAFEVSMVKMNPGGTVIGTPYTYDIPSNTFQKLTTKIGGSNFSVFLNDVQRVTGTDGSFVSGSSGIYISNEAGKTADFDDYRIRKYAATEPTTSIGSIENVSYVYKYTLVNAPGTPAVSAVSVTSENVIINQNSNSATANYAIQEVNSGKYVQADGSLNASAVWQTYAAWGGASGVNVTGLNANTSYNFQVKARNTDSPAVETDFSAAASKYTLAASPNVTSDKTTSTWSNAVPVVFTNTVGFGNGGVTKYKYVWDQTATHSFSGDGTDWNSGTLSLNMTLGNSNYLHVQAYNGESVVGNSANYGPYFYDNAAPTGTALSWGAITQTGITVTASGAADTNSGFRGDGLTYYIERDDNATSFTSADANSGWITGIWSQTSLSPNVAYSYRVKARDTGGNESGWVTPSPAYKYTLIEQLTGATFTSVTNNSLIINETGTLSNLATGNSGICYSTVAGSCNGSWVGGVNYTFNSLSPNTNNNYYIFVRNANGVVNAVNGPYSKYTLANTPTLDAPVSPTNQNKPPISNSGHQDANLANLTVNLYEKSGSNYTLKATRRANGSGVFTFSATDYVDTLGEGAHNLVTRSANNENAESPDSNQVTVSVDTTAPADPTSLVLSNVTGNAITLTWTIPSTNDDGTPLFKIERAVDNNGNPGTWITVKEGLAIDTTTWTDNVTNDAANPLQGNTKYWYRVAAYDTVGIFHNYSNPSTATGATTLPGKATNPVVTPVSPTQINLAWSAPAGGAARYHVKSSADNYATIIYNNTIPATNITGLTANTSYTFKIYSADASDNENSDALQTVAKYTLTNVPTSPSATAASNTQINLSWTAAADSGTVKYHVYRIQGSTTTQIGGDITGTSINDTSLSANTQYAYKIYSLNMDNAESASYATVSKYTLTNTPTIEAITSPTNNNKPTVTNSNHPDPTFTGRTVKLYVDGAWFNNMTATASAGVFTFNAASYGLNSLTDGTHTIKVLTLSQNNDPSPDSNTLSVVIDTVAPTTSLATSPASPDGNPDTSYFKTNPTITLTISDPAPSGGGGTTYYKWDSASYQQYSSAINNLPQGTHTLSWYTVDSAGNIEAAHTRQFKLDSIAPTGTSISISDGSGYLNQDTLGITYLNLVAQDATSGLDAMQFSADNVTYCDFEPFADNVSFDFTATSRPGGPNGCLNFDNNDGAKTVYVQYRDKAGNISSPVSATVTYDKTPPINSTNVYADSIPSGTSHDIASSSWSKYANPKFSWTGASDNLSGIKDYWVYFGTDQNAEPKTVADSSNLFYIDNGNKNFTTQTSYIVTSSLASGQTYYFKVRTKDMALNDAAASYTENANYFVYKFDNTPPANITDIQANPSGYSSNDSFNFSWTQAVDIASGLDKYQYKLEDGADSWHDLAKPAEDTVNLTNIHHYKQDMNKIDVRALDVAGNPSDIAVGIFYYAGDIPAPKNLRADETHSLNHTVNSFKFTWEAPDGITPQGYYYSVNALPDNQNATFVPATENSVGYASFATKAGMNTFYLVTKARDTVGWTNYATATFTCNTSAPGIPQNVMVSDSSNRDSQRWQLTVNWDQPEQVTPDFNGYTVERSTDYDSNSGAGTFQEIATVTKQPGSISIPTGYLDTNLLNNLIYAYRVLAKDNVGNKSAVSSVVYKQPTGKYTSPPNIIGVPKIDIQATKAKVTWTTDRDADSFVQIGGTDKYGMTQGQLDSTSTHNVSLSGLTPGTTYHYRAMWRDIDGNIGYSKDYTFRTQDAPGISEVTVSDVRLNSAIISWKSTTISTSKVLYGKSNAYGMTAEDQSSSSVTVHVIKLDNLDHSSTYHFKITSIDVDGNVVASDDYSFDTLIFPVISNAKIEQQMDSATSTVKVTWETNVPVSSVIQCTEANSNTPHEVSKSALETKHSLLVTNLKDNTPYTFRVIGRDAYGDEASSSAMNYKTMFDTRPPQISNVTTEVSTVGFGADAKGQVVVSWETDEPSTSQVEYAVGATIEDNYQNRTTQDSTLTTSHVVVITDLKPSTAYHFRVVSKDASDNMARSDGDVILTEQATSSVLDVIIKSLQNSIGWLFGAFGKRG